MKAAFSRPVLRATKPSTLLRPLSTTAATMAEGDAGAPKSRGSLGGQDAFSKREAAQEGLWVRQQEEAKLHALRQKLKEQNKSTEEVDKHIADLGKTQGGEKK